MSTQQAASLSAHLLAKQALTTLRCFHRNYQGLMKTACQPQATTGRAAAAVWNDETFCKALLLSSPEAGSHPVTACHTGKLSSKARTCMALPSMGSRLPTPLLLPPITNGNASSHKLISQPISKPVPASSELHRV